MSGNKNTGITSKKYFISISIIVIILFAVFIAYFIVQRRSIENHEFRDLKLVSEMKAKQISDWIEERLSDGKFIATSVPVKNFIKNPHSETEKQALDERLSIFMINSSYASIRIFDRDFKFLHSSGSEVMDISDAIEGEIRMAMENDSIIFTDFFFCEIHKRVHLDLIIPVEDADSVIGFAIIDVLPETQLYPMIQSYPVRDKSSEVLIVREDGNDVLFLNELRFRQNSALKLRIPLTSAETPAVKSVRGETGFVEGIDYRGEPVIAYLSSIPYTNWHMVTKKDKSEVYSTFSYNLFFALTFLLFILTLSTGGITAKWLYDRNNHLKTELDAQTRLRKVGDYLNSIIETSPVAVYDLDENGIVKSIWNREAERMFGFKKEDVIGKFLPIVQREKEEEFANLRSEVFEGRTFKGIEVERTRSDNSMIYLSLSYAPLRDEEEKIDGIIALAQDVTDKKMKEKMLQETVSSLETSNEELQTSEEELISAEEELRTQVDELELSRSALLESEEKFRIALKNANITVFTCNKDLEYTWVYNPVEGFTSAMMIGRTDADLLAKGESEKVSALKRRVLDSGIAEQVHLDIMMNGVRKHFNYNVEPIYDADKKIKGLLCAAMDITEKMAMEEELFQAYKMEAIGQLAGGVAHDFNNVLAGIMGSAEMLQYKLADDETLLVYVFNILKASEHAARLTNQLLSFARKGQYQKIPVSIHRVIYDVVSMLESTIDKRISIEQRLAASPNHVLGDPTQIQNAILNLAINARDAMDEKAGKIIISTDTVNVEHDKAEKHGKDIKTGEFILVTVTDYGAGMTEEVKKHLFEPFFTTKEQGKGTGLGLASIYGIVKNHNGFIEVESEAGVGTSMKIYLPLTKESSAEEEDIYPVGAYNGLGMTVLVVDDEDLIRKNTEEILLKYGFRVLTAKSGKEAVEIYRRNAGKINCVILDMIMPDMDGRETFVELKKINFDVRVMLSTGYSADEEANKMMELGINGFIQKPYKANELLRKLHSVLK